MRERFFRFFQGRLVMRMRMLIPLTAVCGTLLLVATSRGTEPAKTPALAGWLGIFPEFTMYQRSFTTPIVTPEKKPTAYRQTAKYEWSGGRFEVFEVTVARDPAFKEKY